MRSVSPGRESLVVEAVTYKTCRLTPLSSFGSPMRAAKAASSCLVTGGWLPAVVDVP